MDEALAHGSGVVSLRRLSRLGYSCAEAGRQIRARGLERLRAGWYAAGTARPEVVRAVSAGGALSCVSAFVLAGGWRPHGSARVHVRFSQLRGRETGVVAHALPRGDRSPVLDPVDDLATAAVCLVRCLPRDEAVATLDRALHLGHLEPSELGAALERAGAPGRSIGPLLDPTAESGIESLLRMRIRSLNVPFLPQVKIAGGGRHDFLIGDRLVGEADGLENHERGAVQVDRDRDNALAVLGFRTVRFTYRDLIGRPEYVTATLRELISAREHRWTRRNRLWERAGLADPVLGQELNWPAERWQAWRAGVGW